MAADCSSSVPRTTRLGRMKSSIAEPSRRNSGLEATLNGWSPLRCSSMTSRTIFPVPAGTVLLVTTTL